MIIIRQKDYNNDIKHNISQSIMSNTNSTLLYLSKDVKLIKDMIINSKYITPGRKEFIESIVDDYS